MTASLGATAYTSTTWTAGDIITEAKLDAMVANDQAYDSHSAQGLLLDNNKSFAGKTSAAANLNLIKIYSDDTIWIGDGSVVVKKASTVEIQVYDGLVSLATGDGKAYITIPEELDGMNLVGVHARVITAGVTGVTTIQIKNTTDGHDMLSTRITIDSAETGSDTAATPAVINASEDDVVLNDCLEVDVDGVSTTAPKGLIIRLRFALP